MKAGIKGKFGGAVLGLAAVVLILVGMVFYVLNQQASDGVIINVAGAQRMLSQKMTKEALIVAADISAEAMKKRLAKTAARFDRALKGLIDGDAELGLPPTKDGAIRAQLAKVAGLWRPFRAKVEAVVKASDKAAVQSALDFLLANNLTLLKEMNRAVKMYEAKSLRGVVVLKAILLIGLGVSLVVCLLFWLGLQRGIVKPILDISQVLGRVAQGDLTSHVELKKGGDEIRSAGEQLNLTIANLSDMVGRIMESADQVQAAAGEISAASNDLAERTQAQAAAVEEVAASTEELNASVKQNAENTATVFGLAQETAEIAQSGGRLVEETRTSMAEITESSRKIGEIIDMVNEIAFQTNLLALNASVEAARAGEAGRGFAVVAGEVRNLAGRSAEAAKQIQTLIQESSERVEKGSSLVAESGDTLADIVVKVEQVAQTVGEMTQASRDQAVGIDQVSMAVSDVDQGVQHNAALVEETAAASSNLAATAHEMREMVAVFKLRSRTPTALISGGETTSEEEADAAEFV